MTRRSYFRANLKWAFGWTLSFATLFSAYVLVLSLARGSTWFEEYHSSSWTIILGYYVAAVPAGLALAVLRPLGSTRLGAYVVGVVIGFLVYGAIGVLMEGFAPLTFGIALIAGLVTGGLGVVTHDQGAPGWRGSASLSTRKTIIYGVALLLAFVLLWLDIR